MARIFTKTGWFYQGSPIYRFYGDLEKGVWSHKGMFNKKPEEITSIPNHKWQEGLKTKSGKTISWPHIWIHGKGYVRLTYTENN